MLRPHITLDCRGRRVAAVQGTVVVDLVLRAARPAAVAGRRGGGGGAYRDRGGRGGRKRGEGSLLVLLGVGGVEISEGAGQARAEG